MTITFTGERTTRVPILKLDFCWAVETNRLKTNILKPDPEWSKHSLTYTISTGSASLTSYFDYLYIWDLTY